MCFKFWFDWIFHLKRKQIEIFPREPHCESYTDVPRCNTRDHWMLKYYSAKILHLLAPDTSQISVLNYRPQRSWGKVMFLHVSVILFTGGVLPHCMLGYQLPPPRTRQTPPRTRQTPPRVDTPPRTRQTPPRADTTPPTPLPQEQTPPPQTRQTPLDQADTPPQSRLQHTVYEQPVCILLECILVKSNTFKAVFYLLWLLIIFGGSLESP